MQIYKEVGINPTNIKLKWKLMEKGNLKVKLMKQ